MGHSATETPVFSPAGYDRALGVLTGLAVGDALADPVGRCWGNATAKSIAIAEVAGRRRVDLRRDEALTRIARRWEWFDATAAITAAPMDLRALAAPVALAYLGDATAMAAAVRAVVGVAGGDDAAAGAAVRWGAAIRHAVLTADLDVPSDDASMDSAAHVIADATVPGADDPARGVFRADHLRRTLHSAGPGRAAVVGALLGAVHGVSAVPARWRLQARGWPGLRVPGLAALTRDIIGRSDAEERVDYYRASDEPPPRRHPHDHRVWIGGVGALARPRQYVPDGVDAIVSLCPVSDTQLRRGLVHLDVRLVVPAGDNPNLDFVLLDTVRAVEALRAAGRTVFLHGAHGRDRTATVSALYGARRQGCGVDDALVEVLAVLAVRDLGAGFHAALRRLGGAA